MMEEKYYLKIVEIIKEINPDIDTGDLTLDSEIKEIGFDSIMFISLIVAIESEYDFEFRDEFLDMNRMKTIKEIIKNLREHIE